MKKFFRDLSWAQVFAGALAAVTSFFLSAKIGIAGSAIGVAVGSIVSAVASQIYKNVLDASTHKIQETVINPDGESETDIITINNPSQGPDEQTSLILAGADDKSPTVPIHKHAEQVRARTQHSQFGERRQVDETSVLAPISSTDATQVIPTTGKRVGGQTSTRQVRTASSSNAKYTHQSDTGRYEAHSAQTAKSVQKKKQMVLIVSVVSALVAVLLSAVVINAITKGEGTDHVVRNIVSPTPTVQVPTPSTPPAPQESAPGRQVQPDNSNKPQETTHPSQEPTASPTASPSQSSENKPTSTNSPSVRPSQEPTPSVPVQPNDQPTQQQGQKSGNPNDTSLPSADSRQGSTNTSGDSQH